jgi:hypothetical protein
MISLKQLILENIDKEKEKDALYILRQVWPHVPKEDKFDTRQIGLWLFHHQEIWNEMFEISKKYYPNNDEPQFEFQNDINAVIEKLEHAKNKRVAKKINQNDPLYILKHIVRNQNWEKAKVNLVNSSLAGWAPKEKVDDADAERVFHDLYKIAMGETMYDVSTTNRNPKLSSFVKKDMTDDYAISFLHHYAGTRAEKFPDKVKIYRGTNSPTSVVRKGDFVSFDREYARGYIRGKFGALISDTLPSDELRVYKIDIGRSELVYWPDGHQIKSVTNVPTFREFWETWRQP